MKLAIILSIFLAHACTTTRKDPMPQTSRRHNAPPEQGHLKKKTHRQKDAVRALLDMAQTSTRQGLYREASSYVERAYRIDHRDPAVSLEMAKVMWVRGDDIQAEHWAQKSLGLWSQFDFEGRREAWSIIYQSRIRRGDYQGANEALRRSRP